MPLLPALCHCHLCICTSMVIFYPKHQKLNNLNYLNHQQEATKNSLNTHLRCHCFFTGHTWSPLNPASALKKIHQLNIWKGICTTLNSPRILCDGGTTYNNQLNGEVEYNIDFSLNFIYQASWTSCNNPKHLINNQNHFITIKQRVKTSL